MSWPEVFTRLCSISSFTVYITKELFVFTFIVVFFVFGFVNISPDVVTVLDLRQEPSNQLGREHPRIELREQKMTNNLNKTNMRNMTASQDKTERAQKITNISMGSFSASIKGEEEYSRIPSP